MIDPNFIFAILGNGIVLFELENFEEAVVYFKRAIDLNSNLKEAYYWKAKALYRLERYNEALDSHNRALEIDPNDKETWFNKGKLLRFSK